MSDTVAEVATKGQVAYDASSAVVLGLSLIHI